MNDKPISPLRQRMLEDMNMRRFVPDTQREYIRAVKKLASFLGRSPDSATPEELRAFQLHLTEADLQPQSINATVTALRFFFKVTLDRPETTRRLVFVYEPRKLPRVLSPEEVLRLLEAAPGPKHKAALSVAYGAGLRAMEVVALKVCDIDSKRMMLRVEQGKGARIAMPCCHRRCCRRLARPDRTVPAGDFRDFRFSASFSSFSIVDSDGRKARSESISARSDRSISIAKPGSVDSFMCAA
ncbi:MAG TPA: phage integrase N-terminal SAM-like domain-containing protein, partial [Steroidobacteraceae bacterium]